MWLPISRIQRSVGFCVFITQSEYTPPIGGYDRLADAVRTLYVAIEAGLEGVVEKVAYANDSIHILSVFPWPKSLTRDRPRSSSIPPCGSGGSRRRRDLGERSEERDEDDRLRIMRQRQDVARAHILVARVQGAGAAVARHIDRHLLPPPLRAVSGYRFGWSRCLFKFA